MGHGICSVNYFNYKILNLNTDLYLFTSEFTRKIKKTQKKTHKKCYCTAVLNQNNLLETLIKNDISMI